jgi:hypothetical protein
LELICNQHKKIATNSVMADILPISVEVKANEGSAFAHAGQ